MNTWNVGDAHALKEIVEKTIESISRHKDSTNDLKIIVNGLSKYCYCLGHERGYSEGQMDASHGWDERKHPTSITLNSINERKG